VSLSWVPAHAADTSSPLSPSHQVVQRPSGLTVVSDLDHPKPDWKPRSGATIGDAPRAPPLLEQMSGTMDDVGPNVVSKPHFKTLEMTQMPLGMQSMSGGLAGSWGQSSETGENTPFSKRVSSEYPLLAAPGNKTGDSLQANVHFAPVPSLSRTVIYPYASTGIMCDSPGSRNIITRKSGTPYCLDLYASVTRDGAQVWPAW
jgi:hypothetical protein